MTKKHFKALADALNRARPLPGVAFDVNDLNQWRTDVEYVAKACAAMNPRFDRHTFLEAAGYYKDERGSRYGTS